MYIPEKLKRKYSFCLYDGMRQFDGDSARIVLEKLFEAFGTCYGDVKTVYDKCGIPYFNIPADETAALAEMFGRLKDMDIGSWMFFNGVLSDEYRVTTDKTAIILKANWERKPLSEETKKKLIRIGLAKANAVKAEHPECYQTERYRQTRAPKHPITDEQRKHMVDGIRRYWATVSDEERQQNAERRKRINAEKRARGEVMTRPNRKPKPPLVLDGDAITRCVSLKELRTLYNTFVFAYEKHGSGHGWRRDSIVDKYRDGKPVVQEANGRRWVMMLMVGKSPKTLKWDVWEEPYCLMENCKHHF